MTRIINLLIVVLLFVGVGFLLRPRRQLPAGPVPIAAGSIVCADCRMKVSDLHFAAQLQTRDRGILNFDDPTCLLHYLKTRKPPVHATYFHHLTEERWLTPAEVGFIPVKESPMGYNLGAVAAGTPGTISFYAALAKTTR